MTKEQFEKVKSNLKNGCINLNKGWSIVATENEYLVLYKETWSLLKHCHFKHVKEERI